MKKCMWMGEYFLLLGMVVSVWPFELEIARVLLVLMARDDYENGNVSEFL